MTTSLTAAAFAGGAIDVHSHVIPADYLANLQKHNALLDEGFPLPKWDVSAHLKWMDEAQVQTSVLTLAAPQPYFGDANESASIIRKVNEVGTSLKKQHPGRFMYCAALPLPDVKKSIAEAAYALDTLKADCIKLATNVKGQYLGALYYDLAGAHSAETIRMMLTITTPDHLLYGSDYPYVAPKVLTASIERLKAYLKKEADLAPYYNMILDGNARALFGDKATSGK